MSCRPVIDDLLSWRACLSALRGAHAQTQLALWDREVPLGAKCCDLFSLGVASSPACCQSLSAVVALRPILESIFRFSLQPALSDGHQWQPKLTKMSKLSLHEYWSLVACGSILLFVHIDLT